MSSRPFFLQAEIRGETMVGFFFSEGALRINWDWRPYHIRMRAIDVNYRYSEHILTDDEDDQEILRVLHTRWLDHHELCWVELSALRYWLQHDIVMGPVTRQHLREVYSDQMPEFLSVPTVVTEEQYNGYQNTLEQRSNYNMNLSEIALAFAMGHHRRLGAASVLLMLSHEEMTIIWNTVSPPDDTSDDDNDAHPIMIHFDSDDDE